MSVVHRRLGGRRAHLHRDRQPGPALHGRGALQRLRPRAADRDDGRQPRDRRADQHLERPLRLDVAARLAAGSSSTPSPTRRRVDLHVQAFRLAEELSLPVMVCMDGFILTHAFERGRRARPGAGRRLPAAVRAAPGARPRRPGDDRRDGRARGVHRGQVPRRTPSRCRRSTLIPEIAAEFAARLRPRLRRPASAPTAPRTPRRSSSRSARCWARSRTSSTSCASEGVQHRRRSAIKSLPAVPARRGARGARPAPSGWSCSRRRSRSASAASSRPNVRMALSGHRRCTATRSSPASAGGRSRRRRCAALFADAVADRLEPADASSTSTGSWSSASSTRMRRGGRSGPHAENILRDLGIVAARPH